MALGRPLNYDPNTALEAAMYLFWQKGYEATSLQDLLKAMKLSKSSLYQAFGSKRKLFLRCIDRYQANTMAEMRKRLLESTSGLHFVTLTLSNVINEVNEVANPMGCLVTNTATEFAQSDAQIAQYITDGLDGYREMFRQAIIKGHKDGSIRADKNPQTLANFLVTNMSGLRTMVKAGTDQAVLKKMVDFLVEAIR